MLSKSRYICSIEEYIKLYNTQPIIKLPSQYQSLFNLVCHGNSFMLFFFYIFNIHTNIPIYIYIYIYTYIYMWVYLYIYIQINSWTKNSWFIY